MARGMESERSPLVSSSSSRKNSQLLASLAALGLVACVCLLAYSSSSSSGVELVQNNGPQVRLAKALLKKGRDLEDAGAQDIRMAKLMMQKYPGTMLEGEKEEGGNSTDSGNSTGSGGDEWDAVADWAKGAKEHSSLEDKGVNTHYWPGDYEATLLPGYKKKDPEDDEDTENDPENKTTLVFSDYNFENREPLEDAGVKIGRWFWEDDADEGDGEIVAGNETNATGAAGNETETDAETTPEERLYKAKVKVTGWPWDPQESEDEDEDEDEDEETMEDEGDVQADAEEGSDDATEEAAEKAYQIQKLQQLRRMEHARRSQLAERRRQVQRESEAQLYAQGRAAWKAYQKSLKTAKSGMKAVKAH